MELGVFHLFILPASLGLLGFVEPCSVGSSLLYIKYLEGLAAPVKIRQMLVFTVTRAVFIGLLGVVAVVIGSSFIVLQKAAWVLLGTLYALLGIALVVGRARRLMVAIGPSMARMSGGRGAAGLGVLFGLNVPACAAPLLGALLAGAAASGTSGATIASGFTALAVFGLFLSAPLMAAVFSARARRLLDGLAQQSGRFPIWTGLLFIALGAWSAYFGLFAQVPLQ